MADEKKQARLNRTLRWAGALLLIALGIGAYFHLS